MQSKFIFSGLALVALMTKMNAQFSGQGNGSETDPYQISNAQQLDEVRNYLGEENANIHFSLVKDIDLNDFIAANYSTDGWLPIGNDTDSFFGRIDGGNHIISNLWISREKENNVGLFGNITNSTISNLKINTTEDGVKGGDNTGIFAGMITDGVIKYIVVNGNVTGKNDTGGLVGNFSDFGNSELSNSESAGSVFADGDNIGGLVGESNASISNSHSSANVKNIGDVYVGNNVGGLVGSAWNAISDSYATGNIEATNEVGGLVGNAYFPVTNSYATGEVRGDREVGGLAGGSDSVDNSYATGNVFGVENVGGLAGANYNTVSNSKSTGIVTGTKELGGLIGFANSPISKSYSSSNVFQIQADYTSSLDVGGLAGQSFAPISDCFAAGNITVLDNAMYIGGLVGVSGSINNSYASGSIIGGNSLIGGLVGQSLDYITNSVASNPNIQPAENAKYENIHRLVGNLLFEVDMTNNFASDKMFINDEWINNETNPDDALLNATSISLEDLQKQDSYNQIGWDFNSTWGIDEGQGYPYFQNNSYKNRIIYADVNNIEGGSISPRGAISVETGNSLSFIIKSNENFGTKSVMVDGEDQGDITTFTFDNIQENHNILVDFENILSVNDASISDIKVYPNPSSAYIYVEGNEKIKSLQLYNLAGQKLDETNKDILDISKLTSGLYLLKVQTKDNHISTHKIIKK